MAYGYYRAITIDHTKVPGNLTDHPFLFNSTHLDLRTVGNGGHVTSALGYDIVFSPNPDGSSRYDHEIEKYVAATGEFIAHVRIPSISSSSNTVFYIVYGDSGVTTSQENITGVWDANFLTVQHLVDETTSTVLDSTSNNRDGTKRAANEPIEIAGQIGLAQDFDGSDDYIHYGDVMDMGANQDFTLEAWVKPDLGEGEEGMVINKKTGVGLGYDFYVDTNHRPIARMTDAGGLVGAATAVGSTPDGTWAKITAIYDRSGNLTLEVDDGTVSGSADISGHTGTLASSQVFSIGERNSDNHHNFWGIIDEVRVSDIVRSADYRVATYNNQSSPGTFYALQATEQVSRSPRSGVTFTSMIGIV